MKEFLEKFGLTEILGHLFPGLIALCGALLWDIPSPAAVFGSELAKNEFVLGSILLIAAYATGLVITRASLAADLFALNAAPSQPSVVTFRTIRQWAWWQLARQFALMPRSTELQQAQAEVTEVLEGLGLENPGGWDPLIQISVLRVAVADRLETKFGAVVVEIEILRRRFLFSLGVAFALLMFAASALLRLMVTGLSRIPTPFLPAGTPWRSTLALIALAVLGGFALIGAFKIAVFRQDEAIILAVCAAAILAILSLAWQFPWLRNPYFGSGALLAMAILSADLVLRLGADIRIAELLRGHLLCLFWVAALGTTAAVVALAPLNWTRWFVAFPSKTPWWGLGLLTVLAFFLNRKLRTVAAQCWLEELSQTLGIVRLYGHYF